MSYTPTTWKKGDVVTSAKLNNMEAGIKSHDHMIINLDELPTNIGAGLTYAELIHAILVNTNADEQTEYTQVVKVLAENVTDYDWTVQNSSGNGFLYNSTTGAVSKSIS